MFTKHRSFYIWIARTGKHHTHTHTQARTRWLKENGFCLFVYYKETAWIGCVCLSFETNKNHVYEIVSIWQNFVYHLTCMLLLPPPTPLPSTIISVIIIILIAWVYNCLLQTVGMYLFWFHFVQCTKHKIRHNQFIFHIVAV